MSKIIWYCPLKVISKMARYWRLYLNTLLLNRNKEQTLWEQCKQYSCWEVLLGKQNKHSKSLEKLLVQVVLAQVICFGISVQFRITRLIISAKQNADRWLIVTSLLFTNVQDIYKKNIKESNGNKFKHALLSRLFLCTNSGETLQKLYLW